MKIALLNDTHCGARNSAQWMIDYQEKFYNEIFFPYLKEKNIKNIIHLGDYYDNRTHAASVQAIMANKIHFVDKLIENNIEMLIIDGNHDVFYKNTNEVSSIKTYLQTFAPNNIFVIDEPSEINIENFFPNNKSDKEKLISFIPWITKNNARKVLTILKEPKAQVCMGHFELNGFPTLKNGPAFKSNEALSASAFRKFDLVLSGHFHTKSSEKNVTYLGSQMEFTWADCGDDKFFHIFDTETNELEAIRNPLTLFEKVEYDPNYKPEGKFVKFIKPDNVDEEEFNKFLEDVEKDNLETIVTSPKSHKIETSDFNVEELDDTVHVIKKVISDLTISEKLDRDILMRMILNTYAEAEKL